MSEERSGAPAPKSVDGGPSVSDLGLAPSAADGGAAGEASADSVTSGIPAEPEARARASRDSSPAARRRGRMTLRIPDDEVSRPETTSRSDAPPAVAQAALSPPAVAQATSPPPLTEGAVLKPMRIITLNPIASDVPPVEVPPAPPAPRFPTDGGAAAGGEDSWTPFQPTASDAPAAHAQSSARQEPPSDELIPVEAEAPAPHEWPPIDVAPVSVDPIDEGAPGPPPVRALSPTEPEGEEVRFDDELPAPAVPLVEHVSDAERRSDPGAEIAAEDLVAVEAVVPPAKGLANLPPMRPRLDSRPPAPPPSKKATAPMVARPPLVIVPPHVGTMAPQSDVPGARRKGRLWWEDMFNDDYLRTCEKLTDEQIAREVDFVEDSLSIERGGTVLDLACGTGRHAIELARRGYEVVAYDLSLAMLARAGDEAQDREAKLNFIQGDMREMAFEEQFDGVYCWNTSFGYFEEEKNALVIERIHRALKSEGLLLLDVVNRDFLIRQSPSLAWFEGDGCVCMDEMNVDFITSRMKVKRTLMLDDGRSREIEYSLRVYSLHELGRILHEHGFKVCEVSGRVATPSVFFGNESPRTIILAEKR